ncbi:hypothetical protein PQ460_14525 [Paenibacillus sp. KACC 21273]|uniref:hypothetical protein n=2 Tax=unclassified Paenibacillus TaxID=185978 RepID=UPI0023670E1B|nr:hypothetical protein [Paenibacillus sp. KACC 21273]WDF49226.1 hypothetical protein PQ460_14525 [Paenibacillus sp. KACC 21273]
MNEVEKYIEKLLEQSKLVQKDYDIILLTNTRSKTRAINNQSINYSENNEFFSDQEYAEILKGIQSSGYYVESFFNEFEFITKTLAESYYKNSKIIYNLTRHGNHIGKKSLIPSFCDLLSIPYTGSNALVTSFCRSKYMYTKYLSSHEINTPRSWIYNSDGSWLNNQEPPHGTQILIKPMHESASIGLDSSSIQIYDKNYKFNFQKDIKNSILIQEFIDGFECEVPLLISDKVYTLEPVGISIEGKMNLESRILTSDYSNNNNYGFYALEDKFESNIVDKIRTISNLVANLVGLENYGRIDFRITNSGVPYLIDIASSPYTTEHSSFDFAFKKIGFKNKDIYSSIINIVANNIENKFL